MEKLNFDERGLVPAIVQDHLTGEVRMLGYMSKEALDRTMKNRRVTFFSRSRNRLWEKGEESKNTLFVRNVLLDCDGDALLVLAEPNGPTCHTGEQSCFFEPLLDSETDGLKKAVPILLAVAREIEARKTKGSDESYTKLLLDGGAQKIGEKLREEANELAHALEHEGNDRVFAEAADVLYHLLVAIASRDAKLPDVLSVLDSRFGVSGHDEKKRRTQGT